MKRKINIIDLNGGIAAEIISDGIVLNNVQDALDIMADCYHKGVDKIIIHESNITPDFFDLKTRIAGEILQKFSVYNLSLAIVGDFSKYTSKSFRDFVYESNKTGKITFVDMLEHVK